MNAKDRSILSLIKQNPYLSQQEMAEKLGMSRPTLANAISALIKRGEIIGRAYIIPEKEQIILIGGANIDQKYYIESDVMFATSNPVHVTKSSGGVARNIAENLGRLGHHIKMITALGMDQDATLIEQESNAFIDFSLAEKFENQATGSYTAILDTQGELVIAMANMAIYDELVESILRRHEAILQAARCIVIDLNCPKETINYVKALCVEREILLVIVPVSAPKMSRMPNDLEGVKYFICNKDEASIYLRKEITTEQQRVEAIKMLLHLGAENVILTLEGDGAIAGNLEGIQHYPAFEVPEIVDVTGSGDALVAGMLHGILNGNNFQESIYLGLANAAQTLKSQLTVRTDLTKINLDVWRNKL